MSPPHISNVPLHLLPSALPDFERWLGPVTERPGCDLSLADLAGIVARQEGALAAVLDDDERVVALGVTQVRDYEAGHRSCWILAVGGRRVGPWIDVLREIEAGARRSGCAFVEFVGRPAWKRLAPHYKAEPCETGLHFSLDLRH